MCKKMTNGRNQQIASPNHTDEALVIVFFELEYIETLNLQRTKKEGKQEAIYPIHESVALEHSGKVAPREFCKNMYIYF